MTKTSRKPKTWKAPKAWSAPTSKEVGKPITAWSYSRLALYQECALKFKFRNIDKLPEPKHPAMLRGIKIHNEAAKYLNGSNSQLPKSCDKFASEFAELKSLDPIVEQNWALDKAWKETTWFAKSTWLRASLDAFVDYKDGAADIIDHKTGKVYKDGAYRKQLGLFAGVVAFKFPHIEKITARLWYLDADEEVIEEFTADEAIIILEDLNEEAREMIADTDFVPNPTWKCQFCHFRRSNGGPCPIRGS